MTNWAQVEPILMPGMYFMFHMALTVALGVTFQLPILMLALQRPGASQHTAVCKHWRIVVLSFFVIAAMLTPPDPITQILVVTPMLALFAIGMLLMTCVRRRYAFSHQS